jgi:hypothetical protein
VKPAVRPHFPVLSGLNPDLGDRNCVACGVAAIQTLNGCHTTAPDTGIGEMVYVNDVLGPPSLVYPTLGEVADALGAGLLVGLVQTDHVLDPCLSHVVVALWDNDRLLFVDPQADGEIVQPVVLYQMWHYALDHSPWEPV